MAGERTWATQDLGYDFESNEKYGFGSPQHQRERSSIDPVPMETRLGLQCRLLVHHICGVPRAIIAVPLGQLSASAETQTWARALTTTISLRTISTRHKSEQMYL